MSDNQNLDTFRNPDGSTSYEGQRNSGDWEKQQGYQPSPQQSWETSEAYQHRVNNQS